MKIRVALLLLCSLLIGLAPLVVAQELPLILDKPGTFKILSRTDYTNPECGFTKTEITANLEKITELVAIVRKNPVINELKGFEGRARLYNSYACQQDGFYGVPVRICFEFAGWFKNRDGKEGCGLIEPPEWSLYINTIQPSWASGFSHKTDFFAVPDKKETIAPGIDVYDGECFILYNPERPDYWLTVTVKEAFDAVFAQNNKNSDEIQRNFMMKYLNEEWAAIPEADRNKPATLSGMISMIGTLPGYPLIVKVNPDYWDKSKPKSNIQIITFRMITNKIFLEQRTKEWLEKNSTSYHCARFEESLDINFVKSLLPLIYK